MPFESEGVAMMKGFVSMMVLKVIVVEDEGVDVKLFWIGGVVMKGDGLKL